MACRGHQVTLCVDDPGGERQPVLAFYGLDVVPGLRVVRLPPPRTLASVRFRAEVVAWLARHRGGIVYARSKKYAAAVLRWAPGTRLVLEAHEVDSLQAAERGEDPEPWHVLEARVLAGAAAVIANAPGTLALLAQQHVLPPSLVCHNATAPDRVRHPTDRGQGAGVVGSVRAEKDLRTVAVAAGLTSVPITLVTPQVELAETLVAASGGALRVEAALPHHLVPDRLVRFRTLVVPLGEGLFGRHLTSPLKLFDALAVGRPIAGADLPSLHAAAPRAFLPYTPGDPASLAAALDRLDRDEALRATLLAASRVRTWAERAAEIEAFVDRVVP